MLKSIENTILMKNIRFRVTTLFLMSSANPSFGGGYKNYLNVSTHKHGEEFIEITIRIILTKAK